MKFALFKIGKLIEAISLLQKQIEALSIKIYNLDCKVDNNYNRHHGKTFYWREPKEENKIGSEICCTDDNCPDKKEPKL